MHGRYEVPIVPQERKMPGIQSYSLPVRAGQWVIFASYGFHADEVHAFLDAERIPHKSLIGMYKGFAEHSWLIHESDYPKVAHFSEGEHDVLWLGEALTDKPSQRPAYMQSVSNGRKVYIGTFVPQGKEYSLKQDGWTYDPTIQQYYIVEPAPKAGAMFAAA